MNKKTIQPDCESFELLISIAIDGEISIDEQARLTEHLLECQSCHSRQQNFSRLNHWVDETGGPPVEPVNRVALPPVKEKKPTAFAGERWKRYVSRIAMLATAATVAIVMFGLAGRTDPQKPNVDIVGPMVALSEINSQRMRGQELSRELLEMDLRTLRLQLVQLDDSKTNVFLGQIDRLMEKIDEVKNLPSEMN